MNKKTIKVKVGDSEVSVDVKKPDVGVTKQGQQVYSREFCTLVKSGAMVKDALLSSMRDQKIWDDDKDKAWAELNKTLLDGEKSLAKGGLKLSEAKNIALKMRLARMQLRNLLSVRNRIEENAVENQAEQARFNHFVSVCTVYSDTGKPVFENVDDYLTKALAGEAIALEAAHAFGQVYYGVNEDFEKTLPENKFLVKYKLARESDLHLIDKNGKLVDALGRNVDEQGRLVNEKGELVDGEGNRVTEDGDYITDFVEFEDDIHTTTVSENKSATEAVA